MHLQEIESVYSTLTKNSVAWLVVIFGVALIVNLGKGALDVRKVANKFYHSESTRIID